MWKQRVILKDRIDRTVVSGDALHRPATNENMAGCRLLKAGDQTQGRRLAAATRTQQCEKFAILDLDADVINRADIASARLEFLDDVLQFNIKRCHRFAPAPM